MSWGATAKFFHWLVALLIFVQFGLGWLASTWPLSPTKLNLFMWHKSTGMVVLVLVLARLAWRLMHPAPPLPAGMPAWERAAAHASHVLLYVLMIGIPVAGWVINSAAGIPFRIFRQVPLPAIVAADKHTADVAALVHLSLGIALALLLVVHVGAALRHHFIQRDNVLVRMLPFRAPHR
ncbi:cytochrome b [Variovorax sp. J22R133]|uniref:cytochrome b n=1 Tax=Variovorax brevis TaxID=3053503 RepID=UPI0025757A69|nr:cytochrome b [Variovorax sp. J22R133]MDM0112726.1 cytochrome b [Variovorax sp. J22R133]